MCVCVGGGGGWGQLNERPANFSRLKIENGQRRTGEIGGTYLL